MTALVCGSFAYDTIMVFPDQFKNHILPDKTHMLNVAFLVPEMRREFGGCAGNIVFNLNLLGGDVKAMGAVGEDFPKYAAWMVKHGLSQEFIKTIDEQYTAQAYITTDMDDNQITAFHPGAMNEAHQQSVPVDAGVSIGMVSPDGRQAMIEHAEQFSEADIPFIFDPGQGLPMFDGSDLKTFISQASWVAVNDYEFSLLSERTGLSAGEIAQQVKALIVTKGAEGSVIYTGEKRIDIPAVKAEKIVDPTGCGDAYRAGLLYGLMHEFDWETTGRIAALLGSIKVASAGTQNHSFTRDEFQQQYQAAFDTELVLN